MASRKHTTPAIQLDFSFTEPEIWRPVVDYEGFYEVSSLGRVRSLDRQVRSPIIAAGWKIHQGRILRPAHGLYLTVRLSKEGICRHKSVHVLVLSAFIGQRPPGLVANHIDGDKYNNLPSNLEWVSYGRNMEHAIEKKLHPIGEMVPNAKLTESQVREIRRLAAQGVPRRVLESQFGVAKSNIQGIICRAYWKHVE